MLMYVSSECFFFSGFIHVSGGLKCSGGMHTICITRAAQTPAALSERSHSPGSQWQATVYTMIPCLLSLFVVDMLLF